MREIKFRTLRADEIECRVGTQAKDLKWCTVLLYKDARVDMRLLDEVVGPMGWQREHIIRENVINGAVTKTNYCRVSIYNDEIGQWVSKEDIGTESNTENAKGEASDAFKRACFNWGIGRELYSAPTIFINLNDGDIKPGQYPKLTQTFSVRSIGYDSNGNVIHLVIVDKTGKVRFSMGQSQSEPKTDSTIDTLIEKAKRCNTHQELKELQAQNMTYANDSRFRDALNTRWSELKQAV